MFRINEQYYISTDKSKLDIDMIHDYLSNRSYWAKDRELNIVETSIQNSFCFGVYHHDMQVGFARVVTDYAVFVWIMDVFILETFRKKGLGIELMRCITNHDQLNNIRRWGLVTEDAHCLHTLYIGGCVELNVAAL